MELIKNVEKATPFSVTDLVQYESGKVVSLTLAQQPTSGMTLFAFDAGEGISTHAAGGDAMVIVLEGTGRFTVDGVEYLVSEGQSIIMPKDIPHAVYGQERFKMLLLVSF